jgi:hypothetical protein
MINKDCHQLFKEGEIIIPEETIQKWQEIVDILSKIVDLPAALIMKVDIPNIEVFRASKSDKNPFSNGEIYKLAGTYCEKVITSKRKLLVPNALNDKEWNQNPDLEFGMISYLGFPICWPDDSVFGTLCVSDMKENRYTKNIETLMIHYMHVIETHLTLVFQNYCLDKLLEDLRQNKHDLRERIRELEANQLLASDRERKIFELQEEVERLKENRRV